MVICEAIQMAPVKHPAWLLTTRSRVAVAVALTAFLFALSVRDELHPTYTKSSWVFPGGVPHRWVTIALDLAVYGFYCWAAFESICATRGRDRLFIVGLFVFLLSPVKILRPQWAVSVRDLEFFGITVSLVAALSLLLYPEVLGSARAPSPPPS